MRIALLGPVRAYASDGAPMDIGGARLRMLLARLALDAGSAVPAGSLIDSLWGERPPADAPNALQAVVSRLRKALRGAGTLESVTGGYRLAVRPEDVDAHRFEDLAARGRRELAAGRPEEASSVLGAALGLWRGATLADLPDVPFAVAAATRLDELRMAATEDRFEAELWLGRHAEVLADLEAAGTRHPLRERLAVLRMRALYAAGRQSDALAVYEHTRAALDEELGVAPSAELREAHLAVLRGELGSPRTRSEPAPGRLPARLTSFVGRDDELKLLAELMDRSRLVTVVGPGGAGKTRLAVEAVTRHRAHRQGRVWFVPLAGVSTPDRLADAVLGALSSSDLRPSDGRSPGPEPIDWVAGLLNLGQAVLVLDNCEHLVAAVAEFGHDLLDRLPDLRILATSREPLAITGEALCQLGPLALPAEIPEAAGSAAVRLFVDRATAVRPGFALDESTVGPVVDICRRLDGMPLALELAAARLRSMSVEQIARRLDDRFRLLTSGDRSAMPRQRTLLAVVEWSWDLLTEQERVLARRLSVFPAGAGAAAVEAVCSDEALPAEDTIYVLGSLVEKSLVERVGEDDPRYRMLETVRAYAADRLLRAGERETVSAGLVRYFAELAEEHEPLLITDRQLDSAALFDAEYDNLVFALRTAIDGGEADPAWRLLGPLYLYWHARFDARSDTFVADVLRFGDALPDHVRAAFTALHLLANNSGSVVSDGELARSVLDECVRTGAMERYPLLVAVTLLTAHLFGFDDVVACELRRARSRPDGWARAMSYLMEAFIRADRGHWEGGADALRRALRGFEETGERYGVAMTLTNVARSHSVRGEHREAIAASERGVALASELGLEEEIYHRTWLATERMRSGDLEGAWRDVDAARRRAQDRGRRHAEIELLACVAALHRRSGETARADQTLDRLEAMARELLPEGVSVGQVAPARMANLLAAGAAARARELLPAAV
ncbi:BTAD domain-containing putative transcriptional regulator, partial [Nonomuraea sp. NPDC005983]|uniref:BTAD domain-containing putative transcriptional regulator n=1 Tax=Nonomuraea sp. NPDC005983 TaxID=3155595 RepID=UPI0033A92A7E